jgi:hypothetical protein
VIGYGRATVAIPETVFDDATHAHEVIDLLAEDGIRATYEYPGVVCIEADTETFWNTGMHGWDYASVNVLIPGTSTLEPDEDADIHVGLPEHRLDLDPQLIASRWAERVFRWRMGFVGAPH